MKRPSDFIFEEIERIENILSRLSGDLFRLREQIKITQAFGDWKHDSKSGYFYPKNSAWTDKIRWAVYQLEQAKPQQVVTLLSTREENMTHKALINIVSQYMPKMHEKGILTRIQEGKTFIYKIKEQ